MTIADLDLSRFRRVELLGSPEVPRDESDLAIFTVPAVDDESHRVALLVEKSRYDDDVPTMIDPRKIEAIADIDTESDTPLLRVEVKDPGVCIPAVGRLALSEASEVFGSQTPLISLEVETPPQISPELVAANISRTLGTCALRAA